MNLTTRWIVIISAGVPLVLILIGLIVLFTKCLMNRCRKKAWNDIKALPKTLDSSESRVNRRKTPKRVPSERQPLYEPTNNNSMETSDGQISVPIEENGIPSNKQSFQETKKDEHTIVQIQRDRLNQLKAEQNRIKSMTDIDNSEAYIQQTIVQVQKEFEESV